MIEWPEYYPEKCPPKEAEFTIGEVYRFITGDLPQEKDFVSLFFLSNKIVMVDRCQACGLSVFKTLQEIRQFSGRIPAFKKKKIVQATLNSSMGKMLTTPSSHSKGHCTWWIPQNLKEPWKLFRVIENG